MNARGTRRSLAKKAKNIANKIRNRALFSFFPATTVADVNRYLEHVEIISSLPYDAALIDQGFAICEGLERFADALEGPQKLMTFLETINPSGKTQSGAVW